MGSCISYHNQFDLPKNFIQIPITKNSKCTLCMKSLQNSTVKCINCNCNLSHIHCFRLWYSIKNKCPICK
jgi:hypothetical protein